MPLQSCSTTNTEVKIFKEIKDSCDNRFKALGINAECYLMPGGLGVKILGDTNQNLNTLHSLPIVECDLSCLDFFDYKLLNREKISSLILPKKFQDSFSSISDLNLLQLKVEQAKSLDFDNLSVHNLEILELPGSQIKNLGFCRDMPLKKLNVSNTQISDLSDLNNKEISEINLFKTQVKDLSSLNYEELEVVILSGTTIESLAPLTASKKLKKLEIRGTQITDLSPLSELEIEELYLPGSKVSSIDCLAYLPIKKLNIVGLKFNCLECLSSLPLESLSISPDLLVDRDFDLLKNIKVPFLRGPADPEYQTAEDFFQKYQSKSSC
jgi:hypothetical protein